MNESQLQSLFKILNFREFHEYLAHLKMVKLKFGQFDVVSEKEYVDFIEQQRSLVTKNKIIKISKKLKKMEGKVFSPNDFDKFVSFQNHTINSKFNGQRTIPLKQFLILALQKIN